MNHIVCSAGARSGDATVFVTREEIRAIRAMQDEPSESVVELLKTEEVRAAGDRPCALRPQERVGGVGFETSPVGRTHGCRGGGELRVRKARASATTLSAAASRAPTALGSCSATLQEARNYPRALLTVLARITDAKAVRYALLLLRDLLQGPSRR